MSNLTDAPTRPEWYSIYDRDEQIYAKVLAAKNTGDYSDVMPLFTEYEHLTAKGFHGEAAKAALWWTIEAEVRIMARDGIPIDIAKWTPFGWVPGYYQQPKNSLLRMVEACLRLEELGDRSCITKASKFAYRIHEEAQGCGAEEIGLAKTYWGPMKAFRRCFLPAVGLREGYMETAPLLVRATISASRRVRGLLLKAKTTGNLFWAPASVHAAAPILETRARAFKRAYAREFAQAAEDNAKEKARLLKHSSPAS
jgi:hypothetical protein